MSQDLTLPMLNLIREEMEQMQAAGMTGQPQYRELKAQEMEVLIALCPANFLIRFTANKRHDMGRYFMKVVKANDLQSFITETNANKAIYEAFDTGADKFTIRFRKYGRVEFWAK